MRHWVYHDPLFACDRLNPNLAVSPWAGHRWFGYDLVSFFQPSSIVDLGVHFGCSTFCFAQATLDSGLESTRIAGIDTWKGDKHTGVYGDDVYDLVLRTRSEDYPAVSLDLMKMTFAEGVGHFDNESIDIIHIDGLHTYEALKSDFNQWLPKLASDGIMLIHDVAPHTSYGASDYWTELSRDLPNFCFSHSWGLGVVFPKDQHRLPSIFGPVSGERIRCYELHALNWMSNRRLEDAKKMLEERWRILSDAENMVKDRSRTIVSLEEEIGALRDQIRRMESLIQNRDQAIAAQASLLEERWKILCQSEAMVQDRDETIAAQGKLLEERWQLLRNTESLVDERDKTIVKLQEAISNLKKRVHSEN